MSQLPGTLLAIAISRRLNVRRLAKEFVIMWKSHSLALSYPSVAVCGPVLQSFVAVVTAVT